MTDQPTPRPHRKPRGLFEDLDVILGEVPVEVVAAKCRSEFLGPRDLLLQILRAMSAKLMKEGRTRQAAHLDLAIGLLLEEEEPE